MTLGYEYHAATVKTGPRITREEKIVEPLTRGELRALQASARYESGREASAVLGITEATLRNELSRAFKKLGVRNKVAAFQRMGWLRPPRLLPLNEDSWREEAPIDPGKGPDSGDP